MEQPQSSFRFCAQTFLIVQEKASSFGEGAFFDCSKDGPSRVVWQADRIITLHYARSGRCRTLMGAICQEGRGFDAFKECNSFSCHPHSYPAFDHLSALSVVATSCTGTRGEDDPGHPQELESMKSGRFGKEAFYLIGKRGRPRLNYSCRNKAHCASRKK